MFGALLGAVLPSLIGGLLNKQNNKSNVRATQAMNVQQRLWEEKDRQLDRAEFQDDRGYNIRREDKLLADAVARDNAAKLDQRRHDAAELDRQVASRGVDFGKLRDQAIAAGFNPLSVLGNSSLYSTERGAALGSGATGGVSIGGGGGTSFTSGGRGFTSAYTPIMSSGGFIQEALERGIDTFMNTPPPVDPLAEALRHAEQEGEAQRQAEARQIPRSFGYDLTEPQPFEAAAAAGLPPVSGASQQVATSGVLMPKGEVPDRTDTWISGNPARKAAGWSSAADFEDEYGDVASAVYGAARLGHDAVVNARSSKLGRAGQKKVREFLDRATGKKVTYGGGRALLKPPKMSGRDYYGRPLW